MGGTHSTQAEIDVSEPASDTFMSTSATLALGFLYNEPSPLEKLHQGTLDISDLALQYFSIPCSGDVTCDSLFLTNLLCSGSPNPHELNTSPYTYDFINSDDYDFLFPQLQHSTIYSLIPLSSTFTKRKLIHTSQIDEHMINLFHFYQTVLNPSTFPTQFEKPFPSSFQHSIPYHQLHILICRLIYHAIIKQKIFIYYGKPTFFMHGGLEYVLIQHPKLYSELFYTPRCLLRYYDGEFLRSLRITNFSPDFIPLDLCRSAFSFYSYPTHPTDLFYPHSSDSTNQRNNRHGLLFLDCLLEKSLSTLYSFILHHLYAYSSDSPTIVVILRNSYYLDRTRYVTEKIVLEAFNTYLSISPVIYCAPHALPHVSYYLDPDPVPLSYFDETPLDFATFATFSKLAKPNFENLPNSPFQDTQTAYDSFIEILNTHIISTIATACLSCQTHTHSVENRIKNPSIHIKCQPVAETTFFPLPQDQYIRSNPLPQRLHHFKSILPLAQAHYPALLKRFQWHNLLKAHIQYLPLEMFVLCIGQESHFKPEVSSFYPTPIPQDQLSLNQSISFKDFRAGFNIGIEYLVGVQNSSNLETKTDEEPSDQPSNANPNAYIPSSSFHHSLSTINIDSLQKAQSHIKIFSPTNPQHTTYSIQEQTLLDQLDPDFVYSLDSPDNTHISFSAPDLIIGSSQTDTPSITVQYTNDHPQLYTFNYRGDDLSHFNKEYTTSLNYFTSPQLNSSQIKITSPDISHLTLANRTEPIPCEVTNNSFSIAYCALPMNQILAIDTHLTSQQSNPCIQHQSRHLIQLTNHHFYCDYRGLSMRHSSLIRKNPHLCPAICIISPYTPYLPCFSEADTEQYKSCQTLLRSLANLPPIMFVTILPHNFNLESAMLPDISSSQDNKPFFGWDFEFDHERYINIRDNSLKNHSSRCSDSDTTTSRHSDQNIEFHSKIILQHINHVTKFILPPDCPNNAPHIVYHFVVNGIAGYLEILPYINQCALAQYSQHLEAFS